MNEKIKKDIVNLFLEFGEDKLYKNLLVQAIKRIISFMQNPEEFNISPDKELLILSENFLSMYRSGEEDYYLTISKIIRRAAHKIHRLLLKKHLVKKDENFITLV